MDGAISEILNRFKGKIPFLYLIQNRELPINIASIEKDLIRISTKMRDRPIERNILFHFDKIKHSIRCRLLSKDDASEVLEPIEMVKTESERSCNRFMVDHTSTFIASISSLTHISDSVQLNFALVNAITKKFEEQLKQKFTHAKVYLYNGGVPDIRFKALSQKRHIVFYNEDSTFGGAEFMSQQNYLKDVKEKDPNIRKESYSEITVPILYRGKLTMGYIQVNSAEPMSQEVLRAIRQMAVKLEYTLRKLPVPWELKVKESILDISTDGISVRVDKREIMQYFKKLENLFVNLTLGNNSKAQALTYVRSHEVNTGINYVGLSFEDIDALSQFELDTFFEAQRAKIS